MKSLASHFYNDGADTRVCSPAASHAPLPSYVDDNDDELMINEEMMRTMLDNDRTITSPNGGEGDGRWDSSERQIGLSQNGVIKINQHES